MAIDDMVPVAHGVDVDCVLGMTETGVLQGLVLTTDMGDHCHQACLPLEQAERLALEMLFAVHDIRHGHMKVKP